MKGKAFQVCFFLNFVSKNIYISKAGVSYSRCCYSPCTLENFQCLYILSEIFIRTMERCPAVWANFMSLGPMYLHRIYYSRLLEWNALCCHFEILNNAVFELCFVNEAIGIMESVVKEVGMGLLGVPLTWSHQTLLSCFYWIDSWLLLLQFHLATVLPLPKRKPVL